MNARFLRALLVASLFASAPIASQPQPTASPDERLAFLVGCWQTANRATDGDQVTTSAGIASYHWDLDNAWLLFESRIGGPGPGNYEVRGGVTTSAAGGYRAFAYNNIGYLIEYEGVWESDSRLVFNALRTAPGQGSRVVYERLAGGDIRLLSERQGPDGSFAAYFEAILHSGEMP